MLKFNKLDKILHIMKRFEDIKIIIKDDIKNNNKFIIDSLDSNIVLINKITSYIINNSGKRLRPLLLILLARALNYNGHKHIACATIIEFIHTATLLHDDVIDNSTLRRAKPPANDIFGNSASILTGDFLYSRAFQIMVSLNNMQIMKILADATNKISEGEVLQLINSRNISLNIDEYIKIIYYKTSKLFEATCQLAGIISLNEKKYKVYQNNIKKYGIYFGNSFQIINDISDYISNIKNLGKNIGNDLNEGKMTLPIIYTLANVNNNKQQILKKAIIEKQYNINEIINIIKDSGAIDYSYNIACKYANLAKNQIHFLSDSKFKEAMILLCDLIIRQES